jgi:hypothetical protein
MQVDDPKRFFKDFPRLTPKKVKVTSQATPFYNCIAWAAGQNGRWWWPSMVTFWPRGVPMEDTEGAFIQAFGTLGYSPCVTSTQENGQEKVALYATGNRITHAARQLPNGRWTSKIGKNVDIEHELSDLEGPCYGKVLSFLSRTIPKSVPTA